MIESNKPKNAAKSQSAKPVSTSNTLKPGAKTVSKSSNTSSPAAKKPVAPAAKKPVQAKSAQAANEAKITELENKIRHAKVIDESEIDTKTVQVGNTVKVLDMEFDEECLYTIVGSTEVDLAANKISNESPIGVALLGSKKNQVVEVQAPAGIMKYKILSITK